MAHGPTTAPAFRLNQARMLGIDELDRDAFVARFGPLFEHSPWVADAAWEKRPFADAGELFAALRSAMYAAPRERQLALIRAHPDLGERAAVMTDASRAEQAGAGLDRLSTDEYAAFMRTNAAYRERFGFPLVVCLREHTKESVLRAAGERLSRSRDEEIEAALGEIAKIARYRLEGMLG
jgi:OHCU decarboxylase